MKNHWLRFKLNESIIDPFLKRKRNLTNYFIDFSYQSDNGISQNEQGQLRQIPGDEAPSIAVQGQYSYTDPEGLQHSLSYVADENGFQPQSADIPQAPLV